MRHPFWQTGQTGQRAKQRNNAISEPIVTSTHTISPTDSPHDFVVSFILESLKFMSDQASGRPTLLAGLPLRLATSTRAALRSSRRINTLLLLPEYLLGWGLQHVVGKEKLAIGWHHHHLNLV